MPLAACLALFPSFRSAIGAEVWVKVAAPSDPPPTPVSPSDPGELGFLLLSTRIPARRDRGRVHRPRRWADRALHATMAQRPRRSRPLERNGQRDDWGVAAP